MEKKVYLVPHTHYDVAWAFTKEDYLFINFSILRKAVSMIRRSDFRFLIEQTYLLEMIEFRDPELFNDIEKAIADGKIEIVDGQYTMPDPMIPGGEILIRDILVGKRYLREKFDIDVPVAWAADGFGLNAQLPQIYKKSGYQWLAFRRGLPKHIGSRVSEFLWEGLDGTKILSHWMPLGYRAGLKLDDWEKSYAHLVKLATSPHVLMPCGSGGAIPQDEIPTKIEEWNREHGNEKMLISTPSDFFKNLEKDETGLITYKGEMYSDDLEQIFPDVASSRIRLKLAIRECEHLLLTAEKAATLALMRGKAYPEDEMKDLWKKMLFLATHDILPSCGIDEVYGEAWDYIGVINKAAREVTGRSLSHIVSRKDHAHGTHVVVFNPNSWPVTNWVECDIELGEGWSEEPGVSLEEREIPSEPVEVLRWDDGTVRRVKLGFIASVPSLGCSTYRVVKKGKYFKKKSSRGKGYEFETNHFRLKVDKNSGIFTLTDKNGDELMKGNEVIIDEEIGDLYFHKSQIDKNIGSESGEGLHFGIFKPGSFSVEKGPLRTVITFENDFYCLRWPYYLTDKFDPVIYRHKTVEVCKKIIIYKDTPRVDFVTHLNLLQSHVRIRLKFDTCMVAPLYTRQTQFGVLDLPEEKTLHKSMKFPSLTWINCREGDRSLAFLTQGVPINEVRGGEIYCTLLRSVAVLSADGVSGPLIPTPEARELGEHTYRYSVYPYAGDWREKQVHRRSFETSQPLWALQMDREPAVGTFEGFSLEPDNLILSALKKAEGDDGIILRFFETKGEKCRAQLRVPPSIAEAKIVNLLEEDESGLEIQSGNLELDVKPFEIVSVKLKSRS